MDSGRVWNKRIRVRRVVLLIRNQPVTLIEKI
jgi:hypothetical protein